MDENYLDDLLSGLSDEKKQNRFDNTMNKDSDIDFDISDLEGISLDELDDMDNLDLGDLDTDDIDFDDLDVTKLDVNVDKTPQEKDTNDDFDLSSLLMDEETETQENNQEDDEQQAEADFFSDIFKESSDEVEKDLSVEQFIDSIAHDGTSQSSIDESALNDLFGDTDDNSGTDLFGGSADEQQSEEDLKKNVDEMNLDDLFSALGIESDTQEDALDDMFANAAMDTSIAELDEIVDIDEQKSSKKGKKNKKQKKNKEVSDASAEGTEKTKKTFSEILFGTPDEEDEEEERLLAEKKAQKEVLKAEKKAAKDAAKTERLEVKKNKSLIKQSKKEDKKRLAEEAYLAELEDEKDEKKVSTPVVIIVFVLFALLCGGVVLGTKEFDYSQVIKKAADYFERQRYRLAYDEVSGVEVKEDDQELKDRIYTVMYVERLYESYENNMSLGRPDKALDALIRGIEKYNEHYEEAKVLNVVADIDSCKAKIVNALNTTYGLTEEQAYEIMELEGQEYTKKLIECSVGLETGE